MRATVGCVGFALTLTLIGCDGDAGLRKVAPTGFFNPPEVGFGVRNVGVVHEVAATLGNASGAGIQVQQVRFAPAADVYVARLANGGSVRGTRLAPGQRIDLVIRYAPRVVGTNDAVMTVVFETFEIDVNIQAAAERVPPARPGVSPPQLDFSDVPIGARAVESVSLTNEGSTDGVLQFVQVRGPFSVRAAGGGDLVLPMPALAPDASVTLEVVYAPVVAQPINDVVVFEFDTRERTQIPVSGRGVTPGVLTCTSSVVDLGDVPRGEIVNLSVNCEASGGPYQIATVGWSDQSSPFFQLVGPPGGLDDSNRLTVNTRFVSSSLPQTHTATLELVASHGAVTRVEASARTVAPDPVDTEIAIEMRWNTSRTDFDLHLVRAGGPLFASNDDCYWANKNPSWGIDGNRLDDPFLDRDDTDGFGPETINLILAAETQYDVYVQFFDDNNPAPVASEVDVDVRLQGGLPQTRTMAMAECGLVWHVGRIDVVGDTIRFVPDDDILDRYVGVANCPL